MATAALAERVETIRRFNRFYTDRLGLLQEALLESGHSLSEARVLYEIASGGPISASALAGDLQLDPGYLSRILKKLEQAGLIERSRSAADGRLWLLTATEQGQAAFDLLNRRAASQITGLVGALPEGEQADLVAAMQRIRAILAPTTAGGNALLLRSHRPGDLGWIVHRHAALYATEHGFDGRFETMVAEIATSFLASYDPTCEHCWLAERAGAILGSVALVRQSDTVARLRLLYVEPGARGQGLGRALVAQCIGFARAKGYRSITLSTFDILVAARRLYQAAGFRLVEARPHPGFGRPLVNQAWTLDL
jgi:DNA-binding MarR family transcriptional regulator/GNAT superfamily N-acetyltransferase